MMRFLMVLTGYVLVVAVNALANILPINGQNTGFIANRIEVLFTPAGYVFSIWGLIYLLLALWLIRQWPAERRDLPQYTAISNLFLISCALNVGWILLWHYNVFWLTVPVMIGLLVTLILIYQKTKPDGSWRGAEQVPFLDRLPFMVYLGWISVATIANISYVLVEYGWNGWGISPVVWTLVMITIATVLGAYFRIRENNRIYPLVFIWALIGIGVKQMETNPIITYSAWIMALLIAITVVLNNKYLLKTSKKMVSG